MDLTAPAKINLFLRILRCRPDGYHELRSLMVPLSLVDRLVLERARAGIRVRCPGHRELNGPANLAHRAAQAWLAASGSDFGVKITIHKRIPIQAGLGGGSSDAAAVLRGLQAMTDHPISDGDLRALAAGLGADVPFFLVGAPALAQGIGERLSPLAHLVRFWVVLACAPFGHSTRKTFERLKIPLTIAGEDDTHDDPCDWGFDHLAASLANDLQPIGEAMHPVIAQVRRELTRAGAAGALMSGSGPSVFGVFRTRQAAREARRRLVQTKGWTYLVLRAISQA